MVQLGELLSSSETLPPPKRIETSASNRLRQLRRSRGSRRLHLSVAVLQADEAWIFCCLILELALLARAGAWRLKVLANAAFVGIFNLQLP